MRQLSPDEARAFLLERPRTAKLATVRADGRPHVAPVWFDMDGDAIIFTTWHTTVKAATLSDGAPEGTVDAVSAEMHQTSFSSSVTQMDREIATLETILTERRSELDPQTVEVLERNLAVIDAAIAEARDALAADPASQFLAQRFTRAYTSKLTLLRGAAQLPAGI